MPTDTVALEIPINQSKVHALVNAIDDLPSIQGMNVAEISVAFGVLLCHAGVCHNLSPTEATDDSR